MPKIPSFNRNHDLITPGVYLQETKKNIDIYDLRFVKPNSGEYLSIAAIHTIEHLFATWLKTQSNIKEQVISFNPGGCQTMFYLEVFNDKPLDIKKELLNCIRWCILQQNIPGATKEECGNYKSHNLKLAKKWLFDFYKVLLNG